MADKLRLWIVDRLARNFSLPEKGNLFAWTAVKFLENVNRYLEINAVHLSKINPDHKILEIGFGPGLGLQAAYNIVKSGKGQVFGIDTSFYMVEKARNRLKRGLRENKVFLYHGSASRMPLKNDSIDRVFHCNSYYFWPIMQPVVREIYRVMKPGSTMTTTYNFTLDQLALKHGFFKYGNPDPDRYQGCLESNGFKNVRLEHHTEPVTGKPFQAIICEVLDKTAHDKSNHEDDDNEALEEQMLKTKPDHPHFAEIATKQTA